MKKNRTPEEIRSILDNLNNLENVFLDNLEDKDSIYQFSSIFHFLDTDFIQDNQLASIYFQQMQGDRDELLVSLTNIEEAYGIYSGQDISIYKAFNFPADHVHSASYHECIFVMHGNATLQLSTETFPLREGDFIFHPPGEPYLLNTDRDSIVIYLDIRRAYIYDIYQKLFANTPAALSFFQSCYRNETDHNYLLFHTSNPKEFQELICMMFAEALGARTLYRNEIMHGYFELLMHYVKRYTEGTPETREQIPIQRVYYHDLLLYLQNNCREASLTETAEHMHLSKNYISRIVRSETGDTFSNLLNSIRVEKAKEYLSETSLKLEDIAELTGFYDAAYLWRKFKKFTGMSPSEFQKKTVKK